MRLTAKLMQKWREAATVMVLSKGNKSFPTSVKIPNIKEKNAAEKSRELSSFDYNVLLLKRSSKSSFFPGAYVFPGGRVGESDYTDSWLDIFAKVGLKSWNDILAKIGTVQDNDLQLPMLQGNFQNSQMPKDLAFRICAIRETFEESGVLLCQSVNDNDQKHLEPGVLEKWKTIVHDNEFQFWEMCKQYGLVPKVWSLYQWSDWLTPTNMLEMHSKRRFDTMFYLACSEQNLVEQDNKEIVEYKWLSPTEALQEYRNKECWMGPPQLYELLRLSNFTSMESLQQFAAGRERHGLSRWLPVRMNCTDGIVGILPGDELYPEKPDVYGDLPPPDLNKSMSEALATTIRHNRFDLCDAWGITIRSSIEPEHGHVKPLIHQ